MFYELLCFTNFYILLIGACVQLKNHRLYMFLYLYFLLFASAWSKRLELPLNLLRGCFSVGGKPSKYDGKKCRMLRDGCLDPRPRMAPFWCHVIGSEVRVGGWPRMVIFGLSRQFFMWDSFLMLTPCFISSSFAHFLVLKRVFSAKTRLVMQ